MNYNLRTRFRVGLISGFTCLFVPLSNAAGPNEDDIIGFTTIVNLDSLSSVMHSQDLEVADCFQSVIKNNAFVIDEFVGFSDSSEMYNQILFFSLRDSVLSANYGFRNLDDFDNILDEFDYYDQILDDSVKIFSDTLFQKNYERYNEVAGQLVQEFSVYLKENDRASTVIIDKDATLLLQVCERCRSKGLSFRQYQLPSKP